MGFLLEKCRLVKVDYKILESCYSFTCGDDDLDDFFLNDAMRYKEELLGKTYCFVLDDDPRKIVCMFTLSNDILKSLHTRLMYFDLKNLTSSDVD